MTTLEDYKREAGCTFTPQTCEEGWIFGEPNPQEIALCLILLRHGAQAVLFSTDGPAQKERVQALFERQALAGEYFSVGFRERPSPQYLVRREFRRG